MQRDEQINADITATMYILPAQHFNSNKKPCKHSLNTYIKIIIITPVTR